MYKYRQMQYLLKSIAYKSVSEFGSFADKLINSVPETKHLIYHVTNVVNCIHK